MISAEREKEEVEEEEERRKEESGGRGEELGHVERKERGRARGADTEREGDEGEKSYRSEAVNTSRGWSGHGEGRR